MASRGGTFLGLPLWGRCSWEGVGDRVPRDMVGGGGFRRIETGGRGDDPKELADASFAREIRRGGGQGHGGGEGEKVAL